MTIFYNKNTDNLRTNITQGAYAETIFALEKKCVTYSECESVALVVHHAQHMCRILLSSVASLFVT
jgi:hypothetical protein